MMYAKQSLKCIVYECMMMLLAFDTLFFLSDAKANFENITANDILRKTLETVTSRPPMMADAEIHYKWDYSDKGIEERKFVSRVYIRNQQHDTTRDSWILKDGKWDKTGEERGIWDGSNLTLRDRLMPFITESGEFYPGHFIVAYDDKPSTVEKGMAGGNGINGITRKEHFAKLLLESETLRLRPEMEKVDGFACYVLEGDTTSYYHTVWIDPQNGYLHRKIICEGNSNLPNEIPGIVKAGIEVTDVKIEYFEGMPMVTKAKRHFFHERTDGTTLDAIAQEKMSNFVWNPDFESMGAFKMDKVPDGTPVAYWAKGLDSTGVKFHWQGGRIVPNVDEEAIEQIDRITEELMAEGQVPAGLTTVKNTEAAPNQPAGIVETQVDTKEAQGEILSESRPFPVVVLIPIGLLIIGLIGWLVFRRLKA
jgi:hypothetical protein